VTSGSQSEVSLKERRKRNKPVDRMLTCLLWSFNYYKETCESNMIQPFVSGSWNTTSQKVIKSWLIQSIRCNIIQYQCKTTRALGTSARAKDGVFLCKPTNEIEECRQYNSTTKFDTQQSCKKLPTSWKTWSFDDSLVLILNDNGNICKCMSHIEL